MTVRQLIAALKKMPPHAEVAVCAHDHNDEVGEFDGFANRVVEATPAMRKHGAGVVIRL